MLGRLDADPILLYREGDPITLAPGDVRRLEQLWRITVVNALGQIGVLGRFTDRSEGVFVVTVPEPAGASVLALTAVTLLRRRNPR